jgi:hypothetical protein
MMLPLILLGLVGLGLVAALMVFVAIRPVWAAYIFLATQPFVGGIDRGRLIPLFRPSEAIQLMLTTAVLLGVVVRVIQGERLSVRFTRLDRAVALLAIVSSFWPLCWEFARGHIPSSADFQSTIVLWRLASLYALFRWVVRTREQARRCLWILIVSASLLAVLAIVDSLGIWHPGGPWTPTMDSGPSTGRGGATLNSAISVGDYLSYSLGVALVFLLRGRQPRWLVACAVAIIVLGNLGTGQFSAWIGMLIVIVVVARAEKQTGRLLAWMGPAAVLAALVAGPVIAQRLAGFNGSQLPQSWVIRWSNVTTLYLPRLAGFRWVLGVRPDTTLIPPETWRDIVYLESGYLWLFYVGGIPLVLTFIWFLHRGLDHTKRVIANRRDDIGVAAVGARGALWCLAFLSILDPHLTMRGGADLFFCLLGLSANLNVPEPIPERETPRPRALGGVIHRPRALTAGASTAGGGP